MSRRPDWLVDERNELADQASAGQAAVTCIESEVQVQKIRLQRGESVDWSVIDQHIRNWHERVGL